MRTTDTRIPAPLSIEHAEIHDELVRATKAPGRVGTSAPELAAVLHPYSLRQDEIVVTPLRRSTAMLKTLRHLLFTSAGAVVMLAAGATEARAHCDTMDGPVVRAAQQALLTGNVNYVLLWVRPQDESTIRDAFRRTRTVREQSAAARELADYWFFETLVRVHREGEGAPYTGLKPAGAKEHPAVAAADRALAAGKVDEVEGVLLHAVRHGLRERFQAAMSRKSFDVNDVAAGREYINAYVPFLHYVERLYDAAQEESAAHAGHEAPASGVGRP